MAANAVTVNVAVLVGSLRAGSFTRRIALEAIRLAPAHLKLDIVEIGDLPAYNPDLEASIPAPWARFREQLRNANAVLFATPEYNRSVPGFLKNAIDVGSRPKETSVWRGKPAAVLSVSPGLLGAFGANHHLRQSLVFLDMPPLQQPEVYISQVATLLDEQGHITRAETRKFLESFMTAFARWIDTVAPR